MKTSDEVDENSCDSFIALRRPVSGLNKQNISSLPVNLSQGTAGQEVTAYEAMSSLVNYIQPNKFISFDNARSLFIYLSTFIISTHNRLHNRYLKSTGKQIKVSVSLKIDSHFLFFFREKQELCHLVFCGDQRGSNDCQDCCWVCRVSFETVVDAPKKGKLFAIGLENGSLLDRNY